MADPELQWHLDRRVPLALILTLALQSGAGIWWASTINTRVETNTLNIQRSYDRQEQARVVATQQAILLGRIEEQISGLRLDVSSLTSAIENRRNGIPFSPQP